MLTQPGAATPCQLCWIVVGWLAPCKRHAAGRYRREVRDGSARGRIWGPVAEIMGRKCDRQTGPTHRYETVASREEYSGSVMHEALDDSVDRTLALQHFVGQISVKDATAL